MALIPKKAKVESDAKSSALGIAYDMKKKNTKRYAKGGQIPPERLKDPEVKAREEKPMMSASETPAQKPRMQAKSESSMTQPTGAFSVRSRKMLDEEAHQMAMRPKDHTGHDQQRLADGGQVDDDDQDDEGGTISYVNKPDTGYGGIIFRAEGGMVDEDEVPKYSSITEAIMARRQKLAEGGEVMDMGADQDEEECVMDDLNEDAALKENYDEDPKDMMGTLRSRIMAKRK